MPGATQARARSLCELRAGGEDLRCARCLRVSVRIQTLASHRSLGCVRVELCADAVLKERHTMRTLLRDAARYRCHCGRQSPLPPIVGNQGFRSQCAQSMAVDSLNFRHSNAVDSKHCRCNVVWRPARSLRRSSKVRASFSARRSDIRSVGDCHPSKSRRPVHFRA